MADTPHPNARSTTTSIIGNPGVISSGMFSGAQNFMLTGHTLQNITHAAPVEPSDFRTFPLGDIDLQREIRLNGDSGVVWRRGGPNRRLYSARLGERSVTVAMYQGDGADEEWREYMAKHTSLRHSNIIQIYGAASSSGIHATIFHGDLIPFKQWLDPHKSFPCVIVFLHAYYGWEFDEAKDYFAQIGGISPFSTSYTMWIRRTTGRLCVDLMPPPKPIRLITSLIRMPDLTSTALSSGSSSIMEALAINALTLEIYHEVCHWPFAQISSIAISAGTTIHLGMVISRPSNNGFVEIASLPEEETHFSGWYNGGQAEGEIMENGWTRFNARDKVGGSLEMLLMTADAVSSPWLSQSNHIFKRCQITSNFEDYVFVDYIQFLVVISAATKEIPPGFLFLCPRDDFRTGPSSVGWPTCPAYWSLEPSGAQPLSTEEAMELGFPTLQFSTEVLGSSWDSSVYAGLAKFHLAKGFDPYSQDVARHLGHPLYRLAGEIDPVFAHGKYLPSPSLKHDSWIPLVVEEEEDSEEQDDSDSQMDVDRDDAEHQDDEDLSDMEVD
ncbi:hypothetical protein DFH06DRAFT_1468648 [Mycena polygramma]|nr:hypothetical protein DFH06DRAFT_1468648 [Mycena polygramma]